MNCTAMRRFFLSFGILVTLILSIYPQNHKKIPSEKPGLIIGIVIDQMRYDYIYRYWDKYSEGGIKKMIGSGTFCKDASYDYLINETATGYATIATGALPSHHGIISSTWYESLPNRVVYCVEDDRINTVGGGYEAGRYSPSKLLASTIGDELKLTNNLRSKVIGIAFEDCAAIFSAGHAADYAFWYDSERGNWITSSYYVDSLPSWVEEFNAMRLPDTYLARTWETLLPLSEYTESTSDTSALEKGFDGRNVFPYDLKKISAKRRNERDYSIIKYSPYGNTYTKDFAIATIVNEELGQDEYTDFLTVGFSTNEYIGVRFGPNSVEMEDIMLRLDREIEHFLKFIDEYVGEENTLIFLTADHGISHQPGYLEGYRIPSGEFNPLAALSLLQSYLNVIYGKGDWFKFYYAQQLYLNQELIEDSRLSLAEVQEKVVQFMIQFQGISNAVSSHTLQTTSFSDGIFKKIQNGFHQKRSGDVLINLAPGWVEKISDNESYHSSYLVDSHVPLIWYGWKIGHATINRPVHQTDIAATLSHFLDISRPNSATGEVILELVE
jgi:predicted AlkP superfamily pyrophosphatase or phosphodiesterase